MVLVLSISSDKALYLYKFAKVSLRVSELRTWTVGLTLGWSQMLTDGRMNGRKTGFLYHAMPEAGATKFKEQLAL